MNIVAIPHFSEIKLAEVESKLDALLQHNLDAIHALLQNNHPYTYENLLQPLEELHDQLHHFWGPIQHLSSVTNSPDLRTIMHACLPKLSEYHTHISHNIALCQAIQSIRDSAAFTTLSNARQKSIEFDLRDFKLNGVDLSPEKKHTFAALSKALSELSHRFEENVLDATMAWKKHITDDSLLKGIPEHAKNAARHTAEKENLPGWIFSLEAPDYIAVMTYADSQILREQFYRAYVTRASEMGPNGGQFDNTPIMHDILQNRFELAALLGYPNFAEYSLATKMIKKTEDVLSFLTELADKTHTKAHSDFNDLSEFAKNKLGMTTLNAWDLAYVSEKLRQHDYDISPEDLRPYFPEPTVLEGLFTIMQRLYGITLEQVTDADVWHSDVTCYRVIDQHQQLQAHIYFDLYARANKRGGAWMDDCAAHRRLSNGDIQLAAAYVTCNFNAPVGKDPALFSHDDVITLFHECGHALQHILTTVDVANVSGIQNIPWDAVEIASQFFENWGWEKESIRYFAKHYQTKSVLPDQLFERMERAKNFQSAMQMMRQLEFALFDFRLHIEYDKHTPNCIQSILNTVRETVSVFPPPDFNRFQHGFSHIFGGGYAAGYYSYKWAEVMACDAFSVFEEKGIFDRESSEKFKTTFLESGGAQDPMDLFITFRGRVPTVDALLRQNGIV